MVARAGFELLTTDDWIRIKATGAVIPMLCCVFVPPCINVFNLSADVGGSFPDLQRHGLGDSALGSLEHGDRAPDWLIKWTSLVSARPMSRFTIAMLVYGIRLCCLFIIWLADPRVHRGGGGALEERPVGASSWHLH
jgi:hypothetical protein